MGAVPNIQIKNVPEETHAVLKGRAAAASTRTWRRRACRQLTRCVKVLDSRMLNVMLGTASMKLWARR